jgi:hypothetical protein
VVLAHLSAAHLSAARLERRRASSSGAAAIEVIDRIVEYAKAVFVVEDTASPTGHAWAAHTAVLRRQVESGRYYDRDLPALAHALVELLRASSRRRAWRRVL